VKKMKNLTVIEKMNPAWRTRRTKMEMKQEEQRKQRRWQPVLSKT
jgi:hypothetical protein